MKTIKKIFLISAFILVLGSINTANAYVCFLPDGASCAKGDTEGFWPCVGDDCPSPDGKCDASYNSRMSTNECGAACTRCTDSDSPYYGLYKCPENTCNCNEYTSIEAFNECNQSCKVCRIAGDKNYGKYKCPAVPEWGCNPQCEDYTLTAEDECKDCDQCTNKNAPAEKQGLWKCTECDRNIYNQPTAELSSAEIANHCYESETCGCYMKCDSCFGKEFTMQDCQNAGYDSAKNECNGKRGTVYETCCKTCNGYIYSTDLSKTSEGWSCTECPNSCDGGSKYSCSCKEGYHSQGGSCVLNQCTSGVAENTCNTASGYTFTSNGTSFKDNSNNTIRCGSCDVASCPWGTSTNPGEVQCDTRCQMYTVAGYSGGHECYSCVNNYQDAYYAPGNGACCQRHIQGGVQFSEATHYSSWQGERHLVTTEMCRWFNPDYDYSDCEPSPHVSDNICEIFALGYCRRPIKLIASLGPDNSCSYDVYLKNGHIDDDFLIFHDGAVLYINEWAEAHDVSSLYIGTLWAGHTMSIYAIDYKDESIIWTGTVDLWLHQ